MSLKFVTGEPTLLYNRTLIVADLHIGIEYDLYKSGITVPTQIDKMKQKIDKLIKKTKAERIVFLGDIKHQVPGVSFQELREVPEFFKHFSSKVETHIVLGNHDPEIAALVDNVKVHDTSALSLKKKVLRSQRKTSTNEVVLHDTSGFRLDDIYIAHGHAWPAEEFLQCKYLILSHTHPLIEIKDKLGYGFTQRVWVTAFLNLKKLKEKYPKATKVPEIILMPAFNELSGGATLNIEKGRRKKETIETFLGPLTKFIDKSQTEIFLLDGTCLGKLKDL